MRTSYGRLATIARTAAVAAVALGITTPATAQFGGLKKKLKGAAAPEAAKAATPAEASGGAPAAGGDGGTVVLTADVVDHLVNGLKAGEAQRQAATKEDTPYGKYMQAQAAYEAAKGKCELAQQTFPNRMAADQKLMDKYQKMVDKMVEAQTKGDQRMTAIYTDSAMAMQDPSCTVKQPQQPSDYYEAQRDIDGRAERTAIKSSGLAPSEFGQARERAEAMLRGGTPPGDASASEKSAVSARAGELKPLLGIHEARATKAAPPPAPARATVQPTPSAPPGSSAMSACMGQNAQKHEKELRALGERAKAAQEAGNMDVVMAIADTMQRMQTAGCTPAR
jgi:hypothetical protein